MRQEITLHLDTAVNCRSYRRDCGIQKKEGTQILHRISNQANAFPQIVELHTPDIDP